MCFSSRGTSVLSNCKESQWRSASSWRAYFPVSWAPPSQEGCPGSFHLVRHPSSACFAQASGRSQTSLKASGIRPSDFSPVSSSTLKHVHCMNEWTFLSKKSLYGRSVWNARPTYRMVSPQPCVTELEMAQGRQLCRHRGRTVSVSWQIRLAVFIFDFLSYEEE